MTADQRGQFRLQADDGPLQVIAVNAQGYAQAGPADLTNQPVLRLAPWGRVDGTCHTDGKPAEGLRLSLDLIDGQPDTVWLDSQAFKAEVDGEGRFSYPKVAPGRYRLTRPFAEHETITALRPGELGNVEVRPGETTMVTLSE